MAKSSDSSVPKITSECTIVNTTGAVEAIRVMETKIRQIEQKFEAIINTVTYRRTECFSISHSLYTSLLLNLSPDLTRTHPHTHIDTPSLSLSHTLHSTPPPRHNDTHPNMHTLSLSHCLSLSHTHTHTHKRTPTHTLTHFLSLTPTHFP